jgi:organic hydroperoxide reductase OsmC/OhrA
MERKKEGVIAFHDEQTPPIEVAVAPEFFGHPHIASPEELFVASVASCHMAYFLGVAEKMRVKFEEYICHATGILSPAGMDYVFTSIDLDIVIAITEERHRHKSERALSLAHEGVLSHIPYDQRCACTPLSTSRIPNTVSTFSLLGRKGGYIGK